MSKFQRTYTLKIQGRLGTEYTFKDPITCIFDIQSQAAQGNNSSRFMLYNLAPSERSDLQFDSAIDIDAAGETVKRAFQFRAGYESESYQPVLAEGNVKTAFSYRDGPDVITEIEVQDGLSAMQRSQISTTTSTGWNPRAEAVKLIETMKPQGVTLGAIGSLFNKLKPTRGVTWLGSTWDVLTRLARAQGGYACINQQKLYLMGPRDVLEAPGALPVLDATTGLIGTPRRTGFTVTAEMIFEPRFVLMQRIKAQSIITPSIRGEFAVWRIGHRGIISGAKDGGVITSVQLFGPPDPFVPVVPT